MRKPQARREQNHGDDATEAGGSKEHQEGGGCSAQQAHHQQAAEADTHGARQAGEQGEAQPEGALIMAMRVHELHAASVHTPLVLLPAAALVDLAASLSGDRRQAALGRKLWWLGVGAAAVAGVAGMAASQEIKAEDARSEDMMWLHGVANVAILLGATGIALWRSFRRPSVASSAVGLGACGVAVYTAYLGGEMVYAHGVGVRTMPWIASTGVRQSPSVLSRSAPAAFLRDALAGFGWLVRRAVRVLSGRQPVSRGAYGIERIDRPDAELSDRPVSETRA